MEKIGITLGIALLCLVGCKPTSPPPAPPAAPIPATAKPQAQSAKTSLEVNVQPASGITILLDGERVADGSPYATSSITPGPHSLQVRGMGFYPITLPIEVQQGVLLKVPVALRARPSSTFDGAVMTGVPEPPRPAAVEVPPPATDTTSQETAPQTYQELPHGMVPIDVAVVAQPLAPIFVDGRATDGHMVRLRHLKGLLQIGAIALPYEIWPGSVLELPIPIDDAAWFKVEQQSKGEQQLKGASIIKFSHGTVHLRRVTKDGEQSTTIRRID